MRNEKRYCEKIIFKDNSRKPLLGIITNINSVDKTVTVKTRHQTLSIFKEDIESMIETDQEFEGDEE